MWSELFINFKSVLLPALSFISVGVVLVYLVAKYISKVRIKGQGALIAAFGVLGGVVGIMVGASRTPVVGTVLPGILTFVTGLLAYLFSKEHLSEWRPVIPFCIVAMLLLSLFGAFMGSSIRLKNEAYEKEYAEWLLHYEKVQLEAAKKAYFKQIDEGNIDLKSIDPYSTPKEGE